MPRPARGLDSTTICFRLPNDARDRLEAVSYDYFNRLSPGQYDPDEVNVSDVIRTALDAFVDDYAHQHKTSPQALFKKLLQARVEKGAREQKEALRRLEAVEDVTPRPATRRTAKR